MIYDNDLTKSFQKEYELLFKKESYLRERLQNEVTKAKEKLENYLSQSNNEIKMNEKIIKNIKNFLNKERNILKDLAYISKLNKTINETKKLFQEPMKTIKFYYKKQENNIIYEEYAFIEAPIFKNGESKSINDLNLNSPIKEDKKIFIEKKIIDDLGGEFYDEDFLNTLNDSFWDPDREKFDKEGYDNCDRYYDDNDEYIPEAGSERILKDFLIPQMDHFGIQMESTLIRKGMISMEDIMMIIMNIFQENIGMKNVIVMKMKFFMEIIMNMLVIMMKRKMKMKMKMISEILTLIKYKGRKIN